MNFSTKSTRPGRTPMLRARCVTTKMVFCRRDARSQWPPPSPRPRRTGATTALALRNTFPNLTFGTPEVPQRNLLKTEWSSFTSKEVERLRTERALLGRSVAELIGEDTVEQLMAVLAGARRPSRWAWSGRRRTTRGRRDGAVSRTALPASDIPARARELYLAKLSRTIFSTEEVSFPLLPSESPATGEPLDLSSAELRSVSPHHLRFMRNMGQGSRQRLDAQGGIDPRSPRPARCADRSTQSTASHGPAGTRARRPRPTR